MIHRIRIQNYRSIRDVTVDLEPVTVLVGKSGTGKSNFVNAIKFLRDFLAHGTQAVQQPPFAEILPATQQAAQLRFEIEFTVPGYSSKYLYDLSISEHGPSHPLEKESLSYGDTTLFSQVSVGKRSVQWDVEPALVNVPKSGGPALGRLPGLEKVVVAFASLTAGVGIHHFPSNVLAGNKAKSHSTGFSDNGGNYLEVIKEISTSLQDVNTRKCISAALTRINPSVVSIELDSIQNPQTAIVGHQLSDKILPFDLKMESEGFRRFYAHLLALYQSPPKQTLIFEEPENGIYPGALSLLADEFKAAAELGRGQVLLTTHSPRLLDHFEADQIRVVELVNLETQIGPLAEEQREAIDEDLLHAGELLTTDPARLEGAGT